MPAILIAGHTFCGIPILQIRGIFILVGPRREMMFRPIGGIRNGFVPDAAQTRLSLLRLAIQIDGISPRRRARSLPILLDLCPGHTLLWIYANLVAEPLDPPFAIA